MKYPMQKRVLIQGEKARRKSITCAFQSYASILCFYFVMPPKHSINLLEVISPLRDSVCISRWLVVLGQVGMFPQHTHL